MRLAKPPTKSSTADSDAFIREVDEAYRQDRLEGFWSRWGRIILVAVGTLLIAFAGYLYWQEQRTAAAGADAERFTAALAGLDLGDSEARATIDEFAAGDGGYRLVARLIRAGLLAEDGDTAGALGEYRAVAADGGVPAPLRDLARVRAARLSFDEAEPRAILSELDGLYEPGNPWFGVAGEMAAIAMIRAGDEAEAQELLAVISGDAGLPPTIRARASQLAATMAPASAPEGDSDPPSAQSEDEAADAVAGEGSASEEAP